MRRYFIVLQGTTKDVFEWINYVVVKGVSFYGFETNPNKVEHTMRKAMQKWEGAGVDDTTLLIVFSELPLPTNLMPGQITLLVPSPAADEFIIMIRRSLQYTKSQ